MAADRCARRRDVGARCRTTMRSTSNHRRRRCADATAPSSGSIGFAPRQPASSLARLTIDLSARIVGLSLHRGLDAARALDRRLERRRRLPVSPMRRRPPAAAASVRPVARRRRARPRRPYDLSASLARIATMTSAISITTSPTQPRCRSSSASQSPSQPSGPLARSVASVERKISSATGRPACSS